VSIRISIKQGQCIESIAFKYGFFPETVWEHPDNADLKKQRRNPNALKPGDVVVVPDLRLRSEKAVTEKRHRYRRRGVPSRFTLVLEEGGEPRANERYVLWIDGESREGMTDQNGALSEPISPSAQTGRLLIGEGEDQEELLLNFGHVDPIDDLSGVQGRLKNLGLYEGPIDGEPSDETTAAIAAFQASVGLESDGKLDDENRTRNALIEEHGS